MMTEAEINDNKDVKANNDNGSNGFLTIFLSTFLSVFVAEIGDKTQIATLILSAKSGKPFIVFAGAALALICSTLFVVVLGNWLSKNISQIRIKFVSSSIMLFIGIWFAIQALQAFFTMSY